MRHCWEGGRGSRAANMRVTPSRVHNCARWVGQRWVPRRENEDNNVITDLVQCAALSREAYTQVCSFPYRHLVGGLYTEKELQGSQQVSQGHWGDRQRSPNVHSRRASFQYMPHGRMASSPRLTPQLNRRLGTIYRRPELCATFQGMFWKCSIFTLSKYYH